MNLQDVISELEDAKKETEGTNKGLMNVILRAGYNEGLNEAIELIEKELMDND